MNKKLLLFSSIFLAIVNVLSCADHDIRPEEDFACDSFSEVSFASHLQPLITTKCAMSGCHNGDNGSNLNWTVFSNFQSNAQDVKDRVTRPEGEPGHMPASGSLTFEEKRLLVCWVEQGAKAN